MKKFVIIILLMLLLCSINVFASKKSEVVGIFQEIINNENWFKGNYSYFCNLVGTNVEYELYKETFPKKMILGQIGQYYLLLKSKIGPENIMSIPIMKIYELEYGLTNSYIMSLHSNIDLARKEIQEKNLTFIEKGSFTVELKKPEYGALSKKEQDIAKRVIEELKQNGQKYYSLKPGKYTAYIARIGTYDSTVPMVLCAPDGKDYYSVIGGVKKYDVDSNAVEPDVYYTPVKEDWEKYYVAQIKKFAQIYTFNI